MEYDEMVSTTATVALVLGRDDLSVRELRDRYTEYTLMAVLDGLLFDLEAAVLETGAVKVPLAVNAAWLAGFMQVEIGAVVDARVKSTRRGEGQWLEAK